jgi:dihydrofolate reductase
VLSSFEEIADLDPDAPPFFVIGGVSLIAEALPIARHLHLTRVHASPEADTFLPPIDFKGWQLAEEHHHEPDERHQYGYTYQHWVRGG